MRKRRTNIERLCDVLSEMGIRTTVVGNAEEKRGLVFQALCAIEKARRDAVKEIDRISGNAKRLTSR